MHDEKALARVVQQLEQLACEHGVKTLAFDVKGVTSLGSAALGKFVDLHRRGLRVQIRNASELVLEKFRVTRLDTLMDVRGCRGRRA